MLSEVLLLCAPRGAGRAVVAASLDREDLGQDVEAFMKEARSRPRVCASEVLSWCVTKKKKNSISGHWWNAIRMATVPLQIGDTT